MKNILKNSVAISIAFTIANTQLVASTSHCNANENVVFSCNTGKKVVSVCASKNIGPKTGYLQYRFGKIGSPEALIPSSPESFRSSVTGSSGCGASCTDVVTFRNGDFSYSIVNHQQDYELQVSKKNKNIAVLECPKDNDGLAKVIGNIDTRLFAKWGIRIDE
ncbi:MAG: hypothetical protein Q8J85_07890 [Sulfuricurvum sp.]|nr:hypothetical protein [Sulfuricurvum sp.]MDP3023159.1 hypothetical protein [Sulfuricurvum sp.]